MEHPVEITLGEAYKGTERELELRGEDGKARRLAVKIPAGVRDGQRIRLAGQAHAGDGTGRAGDLFVTVKVVLPTKLSDQERESIRALAAAHSDDVRAHLL